MVGQRGGFYGKSKRGHRGVYEVANQLINDCKSAASVDEFLQKKCGIILNNDDTGAITGSDAGGSKIKTVKSVVPETGKASYPSGTSFTKRGLKVIVPKKSSLTKTQRIVVQGLYSWWIDEALKLIEESYGYSFTDNDVTVKEMTLEFIDDPYSDVMAYVTPGLYTTNGVAYNAGKLTLTVNIDRFKNITAKDINGSKETYPFYLDRLLAHELTHAIMAAKVNNFSDLPKFIAEGIAELTHGADDIRTSEIETLASNPSQLENILKGDNSYPYLDYAAGYIFLRYLAQQVSEGNDTIPVDPNANEFIENTLDGEIIQTQNGDDSINNSGSKVTISSGKGKDIITNYGSNVSINLGKGNDDIYNFGNIVKINGGAGKDSIGNWGSSRVTIDGGIGNDYILNGQMYDDFVVAFGGQKVSINGGSGNDYIFNGDGGFNGTILGGNGNDTIENRHGSLSIINAGNGNDYVYNKGTAYDINLGAGNDTLFTYYGNVNGGTGDDLIQLNEHSTNSEINYTNGDGNDTIYGYNFADTVNLTEGSITGSVISGDDLILNIGKGSIRFVDALIVNVNGKIINPTSNIGTKSKDTINNVDSNVVINGYGGNDKITNVGEKVTINAGKGNNIIKNYGIDSIIRTGNGKNIIYSDNNLGVNSINSGTGNDYIDNDASNVTILGGSGNDEINNSGDYTTINAGAGNDLIYNNGSNALINGGAGNDNIGHDFGNGATLNGGDGNDNIGIGGSCSNVTINGGKGNDYIGNILGSDVSLDGGAGDDTIRNYSQNVTIAGSKGNDYVSNDGIGTAYVYTAGNDTIEGFNETSTIVLGAVKVNSSVRSGDTVNLKLSNKKTLTLENYGAKKINIVKSVSDVKKVNIIKNNGSIIKGTNQNDYINSWGNNVTIEGGKGNNYIEDGTTNIGTAYVYSGGNDTIKNFNELDTIVLGSVTVKSSMRSADDDIILKLSNKKTLTLTHYWEDKINLVESISDVKKINIISNTKDATTVNGTNQSDYIDNWSKDITIKGGKGNDYVYGEHTHFGTVYVYSAGDDTLAYFNESDTIVLGSVKVNSSIRSDDGTVTLNLSNKKTLTLRYYGEDKINIVESINSQKNLITNDRSSVTVKGTKQDDIIYSVGDNMTINGGNGNDNILLEKYLDDGTYYMCDNVSINAGKGNDYVKNLWSSNVTIDGGKGNDYIDSGEDNVSINGGLGNDTIRTVEEMFLLLAAKVTIPFLIM